MIVERGEPLLPEAAVALDPFGRRAQGSAHETELVDPTVLRARQQPDRLEGPQVLGNRRQRHVERRRELADRSASARQACDDRSPRRVGERRKHRVERARSEVDHTANEPPRVEPRQSSTRVTIFQPCNIFRSSAMSGRNDGRSWTAAR